MAQVQKTITVNQPISTCYNQWTQFEQFPEFMQGVEKVVQIDDQHLHWTADIGFVEREWNATITEQIPDRVIAWTADGDVQHDGRVSFVPQGSDQTEIILSFDYDPDGFMEKAGDKLGIVDKRVEGDLERFKKFIEARGAETGGYRGEINNPGI